MNILIIVLALVVGFVVWTFFGFLQYKRLEAKDKSTISQLLSQGHDLMSAFTTALADLNTRYDLSLSQQTISHVANKIAEVAPQMGSGNVIEIYSTFVHRYLFRDKPRRTGVKLGQTKVVYAADNIDLQERNGYFVIRPDTPEDIELKYPEKGA